MEQVCKFGLEYEPTETPDPVAADHVRNCADCQDQVLLLDGPAATWSHDTP